MCTYLHVTNCFKTYMARTQVSHTYHSSCMITSKNVYNFFQFFNCRLSKLVVINFIHNGYSFSRLISKCLNDTDIKFIFMRIFYSSTNKPVKIQGGKQGYIWLVRTTVYQPV